MLMIHSYGAWQVAIEKMQLCVTDVQNWMTSNKLKLNENKTEFIVLSSLFGTPQNLKKLPKISLHMGDTSIDPTDSVRNLGIQFDFQMIISKQVSSSLCQSVNFQLRNLRRIKRYLDKDTLHHVARALVLSRIDYGNLLLFGATSYELDRVQR